MPKAGSSSSGYVRRKVEPYPHVQSRKESNQRDVRLSTASKRPGAKSVAKVLIQLSDASQRRERTRNFQSRKSPLSIDSSNPQSVEMYHRQQSSQAATRLIASLLPPPLRSFDQVSWDMDMRIVERRLSSIQNSMQQLRLSCSRLRHTISQVYEDPQNARPVNIDPTIAYDLHSVLHETSCMAELNVARLNEVLLLSIVSTQGDKCRIQDMRAVVEEAQQAISIANSLLSGKRLSDYPPYPS